MTTQPSLELTVAVQAVTSVFQPSPQQSDFFDWIQNGSGSCVLTACAGAGKTTTLIEALKLMKGSIFFGAYNKKIADEISERAPAKDGLVISTMHAIGFKLWRNASRTQMSVDNNKCRTIFREASSKYPEYVPFEGVVLSLVSYAKQAAIGILKAVEDASAWLELIEHFNLDTLDSTTLVIQLAKKTLAKSVSLDQSIVDFDDMIYAPLIHKVKGVDYDWVLLDEAQDTNAARRALSLLLLKRGGRLVAVGDNRQAIYGFTGADSNAIDLISKAVNAKHLPLTVSYRCPQLVVAEARKYVNHIEAHSTAPMGSVSYIKHDQPLTTLVQPGDAILSRFNAPIIKIAYTFIAAGIPAKVEGRDIGKGLMALVKRWKVRTFDSLIKKLDTYANSETAKYRAKEKESQAVAVEDKVECLKIIIERVRGRINSTNAKYNLADEMYNEINSIFGDNVTSVSVLLSTIHKSKGREWNKVFYLQTGPSKFARQQWEFEQEANLCYVAITRAKRDLFYVEMPPKVEK